MQMPGSAEHGAVGPTGNSRPGPPGLPLRRLAVAGMLAALASTALATLKPPSGTQALFTTRAQHQTSVIEGAIWAPDPPAACGTGYASVVYGTMADDVLYGGNRPQVIMGLGGNDTIVGGTSGDCLVGGPGDDHLFGGNAKDILIGEDGNDVLDGGNGKDTLLADEFDTCLGGRGKNTEIGCGPSELTSILTKSLTEPPAQEPHTALSPAVEQLDDATQVKSALEEPLATEATEATEAQHAAVEENADDVAPPAEETVTGPEAEVQP